MQNDQLAAMMGKLLSEGPWGIMKWMFVLALSVYLMFGIVVVRQTQIMGETIEATNNGVVKMGAWLHFGVTVFILIVALLL